ncbi:MAG: hypothetical protein SynsKO_33820 [Synoicihabitans sp.]
MSPRGLVEKTPTGIASYAFIGSAWRILPDSDLEIDPQRLGHTSTKVRIATRFFTAKAVVEVG